MTKRSQPYKAQYWKNLTPLKGFLRRILSSRRLHFLHKQIRGLGSSLLYHRVLPSSQIRQGFSPNRELVVSQSNFEQQMRYISNNYDCLSEPEAIEDLKKNKLIDSTVVVTFDDGYLDNLTVALPILEKYNVPATIYVTPGLVDGIANAWWFELENLLQKIESLTLEWQDQSYAWNLQTSSNKQQAFLVLHSMLIAMNEKEQLSLLTKLRESTGIRYCYKDLMLKWDQVRALSKHPLITIGAHSSNHLVLSQLSHDKLHQELREAKLRLEQEVGQSIDHFAYPFGQKEQASKREFMAASQAGFASSFTTRIGHLRSEHSEYLHALPRITITNSTSFEEFCWMLTGLPAFRKNGGNSLYTE